MITPLNGRPCLPHQLGHTFRWNLAGQKREVLLYAAPSTVKMGDVLAKFMADYPGAEVLGHWAVPA